MLPIVLVTGANGFVGRHVVSALTKAGWHVRRAQRTATVPTHDEDTVTGLELAPTTDWTEALDGVQAVVHLAARAHRPISVQHRERELYFSINVDGTRHLARSAALAGVRHFIFLSSIAVNGSTTNGRQPFDENDSAGPTTIYGHSKAAAEEALAKLGAEGVMTITALRAPMIYGRGAGGNFQRLLLAVHKNLPLPFSMIHNRRAFLGIENLSDFIAHRLSKNASSDFDIFLLADEQQISTPDFIRELARANAQTPRLFPVPPFLLRAPLRYLGLSDALLESLEINTAKARATGWQFPLTLKEGLARAVAPPTAARP